MKGYEMYCDETVRDACRRGYDSWNERGPQAESPFKGSVLLDWAWSEGWVASSRGESLLEAQRRVSNREARII